MPDFDFLDKPRYYYTDSDNKKRGPVSKRQLKKMAEEGVIETNTLIRTVGGGKFVADMIPGIFPDSLAEQKLFYYVGSDGLRHGPVSRLELDELEAKGFIARETEIILPSGKTGIADYIPDLIKGDVFRPSIWRTIGFWLKYCNTKEFRTNVAAWLGILILLALFVIIILLAVYATYLIKSLFAAMLITSVLLVVSPVPIRACHGIYTSVYPNMYHATETGFLTRVAYFIEKKGYDVNMPRQKGRSETMLHVAAKYFNLEMIEYLITQGADVNAKDNTNQTPLHYAVQTSLCYAYAVRASDFEALKFLIAQGADVNAKDNTKQTPLHYATRTSNLKTIEFLIAQGADVNATGKHGKTPLNIAMSEYEDKIVKILRARGGKTSKELRKGASGDSQNIP